MARASLEAALRTEGDLAEQFNVPARANEPAPVEAAAGLA
jgi:hypothetical protein